MNSTLEKHEVTNQSNRVMGESEPLCGKDDLHSGDRLTEGKAFPGPRAPERCRLS